MIYSGEVDIIDRVLDVGKHIIIVDEDDTDYHSLCLDSVCRLCREKDNYVVFINRDFNIGSIDRRNILYAYHTIEDSKDYITVEPLVYKLYRDSTT